MFDFFLVGLWSNIEYFLCMGMMVMVMGTIEVIFYVEYEQGLVVVFVQRLGVCLYRYVFGVFSDVCSFFYQNDIYIFVW